MALVQLTNALKLVIVEKVHVHSGTTAALATRPLHNSKWDCCNAKEATRTKNKILGGVVGPEPVRIVDGANDPLA